MVASGSRSKKRSDCRPVTSAQSTFALGTMIVVCSLIGGCGYSVRAPFDKSVRTVFVPVFKTQSFRRDINLNLTEMIQKEIMNRTPYKVVGKPEGADTVLEGTINYADKNIVVENPFNLPRQLNATINVSVKWIHNPRDRGREDPPADGHRRDRELRAGSRRDRDDGLLPGQPATRCADC